MSTALEQLAVNTIKALAMDAVQKANSGHPGMPMGMADIAVTLWSRFLKVNPEVPDWPDRDRFVLSNGHGSMLLYSLLHLAGFPVTLDDIKNFRQWDSHTAGHPEIDHKLGIEMTTGPLGQGFAAGVGMALAESHLRARLGPDLVDHRTFGFVSDGDLMEGISTESASLAGHFGLGKLIYFYDDNDISIDGSTDITFGERIPAKFDALGWHTLNIDGHQREAIATATQEALATEDRPTLIVCRTHIAHGAPHAHDTSASHGSPLGAEEIELTKKAMGYPIDPTFFVDERVYEVFRGTKERGRDQYAKWSDRLEAAGPDTKALWTALYDRPSIRLTGPGFEIGAEVATRSSAGSLFAEIAEKDPGFIGGAADLAGSTKTVIEKGRLFSIEDPAARDIPFGVREHAMGAIVNGMAIHGGLRAYGATFFVFSDYMRPAVRLSALMQIHSLWVWTHDSIFLGEDGPTHQPIEHLASLRAMPNLWVLRPADAHEAMVCWELALNRGDGPSGLVLSRQNLPTLPLDRDGVNRGGYVVREGSDITILATGSEVHTALEAASLLSDRDVSARVVSLPCWELFAEQADEYRQEVLGSAPRLSVEAASTFGWDRLVGDDGAMIGIDHFGASAPDHVVAEKFGFTAEDIAAAASEMLNG